MMIILQRQVLTMTRLLTVLRMGEATCFLGSWRYSLSAERFELLAAVECNVPCRQNETAEAALCQGWEMFQDKAFLESLL